ncbi:MAG: hypothetical protein AB8C46_20620 [Burkholderiaceae bacterium]
MSKRTGLVLAGSSAIAGRGQRLRFVFNRDWSAFRRAKCCHLAISGVMLVALLAMLAPVSIENAQAQSAAQSKASPVLQREAVQLVDRPFGLQIGDLVARHITLRGAALTFATDKLPEPGPITPWLSLRSVEVKRLDDQHGDAKRLTLVYQITGAGASVTLVELPVLRLLAPDSSTGNASSEMLARLDATPVSVSPILGERPFQRIGLGDLQADALVPLPDRDLWLRLFWMMTVAAVCLGGFLLARTWWRLRPDRQTPFVRASTTLRNEQGLPQAYQSLHRAFDKTASRTVLSDDVPHFVETHPAYGELADDIQTFFRSSREQFFNQSEIVESDVGNHDQQNRIELNRLRALADELARIERKLS